MRRILRTFLAACIALVASASAPAQGLVAYYQIGGAQAPWVKWDTFVVDSGSLASAGNYIKYKAFRITINGSDPPQELKADCKTRQRGVASEASMYSTYDGTLNGEEVKVACALAEKKGLLGK